MWKGLIIYSSVAEFFLLAMYLVSLQGLSWDGNVFLICLLSWIPLFITGILMKRSRRLGYIFSVILGVCYAACVYSWIKTGVPPKDPDYMTRLRIEAVGSQIIFVPGAIIFAVISMSNLVRKKDGVEAG